MNAPLHLVRIPLRGERLYEFGRRRGLAQANFDEGYAAHCALRELFGDLAPQPFVVEAVRQQVLPVLGYTHADRAALEDAARLKADPWLWEHLVVWDDLAAKPMPSAWRVGQRVGFTVRATPVGRAAQDHPNHRAGREVDVFLLASRAQGLKTPGEVNLNRETVYEDWFRGQVARLGGATVESVAVTSFQVEPLSRRHHANDVRTKLDGRPVVALKGALTVTDPAAFAALLARGVGRHRAFGFGMLLLGPPPSH